MTRISRRLVGCSVIAIFVSCGDPTPAGSPAKDTGQVDDADGNVTLDTTDPPIDGGDTTSDVSVPPWFGEPCSGNDQCKDEDNQGFCVQIDQEGNRICTITCVTVCPTGYSCVLVDGLSGSDPITVCMPDKEVACKSCEEDKDCIFKNARCIVVGQSGGQDDMRCVTECENGACDDDYVCQVFQNEDDTTSDLCVPDTGGCICFGLNDLGAPINGSQAACTATNEFGTCMGVETCQGSAGWVGCTAAQAAAEVCDGTDNDCDGQTDEDTESQPCEVTNAFGTCTGNTSCKGASGAVCDAATPEIEVCDGQDNNCNGQIDEGCPPTGVQVIFPSAVVTGTLDSGTQLMLSVGVPGVVGKSSGGGVGFSVDWGFYYTLP